MTREFLQETNFQDDVDLDTKKEAEVTNKIKEKEDRNRWRNPYDEMSM